MDWLTADEASLAAALGSPGTPGHPVLHGARPSEHRQASAERRSMGSGGHPSTSMLPSLSALLGSQLASRSANDDLAASLGNFSPREWGLDLAEPLPHEEDSAQPQQEPESPGHGGRPGAAGLTAAASGEPQVSGILDPSLQRGQPLRFVGGSSAEPSGQQQQQQHPQWQHRQDADGQQMGPPQPQKRKPGRPRGLARWRPAAAGPAGYDRLPVAAEQDPDLWNNVRRTMSSVNFGQLSSRSFDEDPDDRPAKRSRRSTARAMESAELEAMDVFGDKEDEEDRWRAAKGRSSVTHSQRLSSTSFSGSIGGSGRTESLPIDAGPAAEPAAAVAAPVAFAAGADPAPPKRRGRPPRDISKQVHGPQQEMERLRDELVRAHSINGRLQLQVQTLSREVLRLQRVASNA